MQFRTVALIGLLVAFSASAGATRYFGREAVVETEGYKSYVGYTVWQIVPTTDEQVHIVARMSEALGIEFDFWKAPSRVGKAIDVMLAPEQVRPALQYLQGKGLKPVNKIKDLGKHVARDLFAMQSYTPFKAGMAASDFDFDKYHSYDSIIAWIESVATANPTFVSIDTIGQSLQNREIKYLKIGYPSATKAEKNALFIDAGIHAREWIAPAAALYLINQLVTNSTYTSLLQAIDIIVVPELNPDGYEYSRNSDRMWRKSRSGPRRGCYGADINRNFPFKWMVAGSSNNPCSETYAGPSALSEIEGQRLKAFLDPRNNTIKAYLTLHSYGEDILYPWGYTTGHYPPDVNDLKALGQEMFKAIKAVHGTEFEVGNSGDALYPASGASDDYSKSIGIKYVYTVELRPGEGDNDNDQWYGFELPEKFIKPTVEETLPALIAAANRVQNGPL
uniref:Peptidase_M14 domain-containing protein n=1 Tax=Panagrellus redivivus TaxID=6233 RepID=A0A7E4VDK1_PANRE